MLDTPLLYLSAAAFTGNWRSARDEPIAGSRDQLLRMVGCGRCALYGDLAHMRRMDIFARLGGAMTSGGPQHDAFAWISHLAAVVAHRGLVAGVAAGLRGETRCAGDRRFGLSKRAAARQSRQ